MKQTFLSNVTALYGSKAPARLITMYRQSGGPLSFLRRYWTTQYFTSYEPDSSMRYGRVRSGLEFGMALLILGALFLFYFGITNVVFGGVYLGAALLVGYPVVLAHVLFVMSFCWAVAHPKRYGKALLCQLLEAQVRVLRARNDFTLIAVAGSVGKTSTKLAIAELLKTTKRVRYQQGNYNDRLTVPLVFFDATEPSIYNVAAWAKLYMRNRRALRRPYPYDVVVVELGTDGPGQMKQFAYLRPDLTVVTSVADEHMEYFKTLDAVAAEELQVFAYSTQVLLNVDDVDKAYLASSQSYVAYGTSAQAEYSAKLKGAPTAQGQKLNLELRGETLHIDSRYYGTQGAKIMLAAAAVAHMLELSNDDIAHGLAALQPFAGRMQVLHGVKDTTLFDDTYNASPLAVKAALDVLYAMKAPQRIAILGSMNELGDVSAAAHTEVGAYCDPKKLDYVITIGAEANTHLAAAAEAAGCTVKSFTSPREAGAFVRDHLKKQAVVLAKGSQNGVFAEEALKPLLADPADAAKLVRQSDYWMSIKRSQFGG